MVELKVYYHSSEHMDEVPDESVHLIITSPPYNVGKNYGENYNDSQSIENYIKMISSVVKECYKKAVVGGRFCINVPFIGNSYFLKKSDQLQFYPNVYTPIFQKAGWSFRDFIIWIKGKENDSSVFSGDSTKWGSWLKPSCPYLRCFAEAILVFHKQDKILHSKNKKTDLTKEIFLRDTKNVWYFPAETKREHPAPFPLELPLRLIRLYSFVGDTVLDPFLGSGTTLRACRELGRNGIGYEINEKDYRKLIERKVLIGTPNLADFAGSPAKKRRGEHG